MEEDGDSDGEYAADNASGGAGLGTAAAGDNSCALVWQGITAKRAFTGFRFQECKSGSAARKVLEAKSLHQYYDACLAAAQ